MKIQIKSISLVTDELSLTSQALRRYQTNILKYSSYTHLVYSQYSYGKQLYILLLNDFEVKVDKFITKMIKHFILSKILDQSK